MHRRCGLAVFFESSGGQSDKVAYLPDIRFAIGEPGLDTTSIDTAVSTLQRRGYYLRKAGTDGYRFFSTPTLNKVVADRKASLDPDEIAKVTRTLVEREFEARKQLPVQHFRGDPSDVADSTRLTAVVLGPEHEWREDGALRTSIGEWTTSRGKTPRLYPGALLWVVRKPGRDLKDRVEAWMAWQRVERDIREGLLGDIDKAERGEVVALMRTAEKEAADEVWASYKYVVLSERDQAAGVGAIDIGAGHPGSNESITGRIVAELRSKSLLNESPGAGYLERRWPPAFKDSGAWPLASLRQAFLSGAMERLLDVDAYLKAKVPEFVKRGDFALASGQTPGGGYQRLWFGEDVSPDEVTFDADVFLVLKAKARSLQSPTPATAPVPGPTGAPAPADPDESPGPAPDARPKVQRFRLSGDVPPEAWTRLGTKLIPKLRTGRLERLRLDAEVEVDSEVADSFRRELLQTLADLGLDDKLKIE